MLSSLVNSSIREPFPKINLEHSSFRDLGNTFASFRSFALMKTAGSDKALILLRGLPGSGKSTLAGILSENGKYPVFSIDQYFTDPKTGEYKFNHLENHKAYKACEQHTETAMKAGVSKIFVDNTFTIPWELEPYFVLAAANGYSIFVTTVENYHNGENIHGIPMDQLEKMALKYRVKLLGSTD